MLEAYAIAAESTPLPLYVAEFEETGPYTVTVSGVPTGATLSMGRPVDVGVWRIDNITATELSELEIRTPETAEGPRQLSFSVSGADGAAPSAGLTKGVDLDFDLVVDPESGDDAASGTSDQPLRSLTGLKDALNQMEFGQEAVVLIKAGHYLNQDLNLSSFGGKATLVFEPGTTIEWAKDEDISGIQANRVGAELVIYGNGLHITGFETGTGNGLGVHGATMTARDVLISNVLDGISAHREGHISVHNCAVVDAHKFAVAHIVNSTSYHENCYFEAASDAIGTVLIQSSESHVFTNSSFQAASGATNGRIDGRPGTVVRDSQVGSATDEVVLAGALAVSHSFLNATSQGNATLDIDSSFGHFSARLRPGGELSIADSTFSSSGANGGNLFFSNHDFGAIGAVSLQNSVFHGYDEIVRRLGLDLEQWASSGSAADGNIVVGAAGQVPSTPASDIFPAGAFEVQSVSPSLGFLGTSMADYLAGTDGAGLQPEDLRVVGNTSSFTRQDPVSEFSVILDVVDEIPEPIALTYFVDREEGASQATGLSPANALSAFADAAQKASGNDTLLLRSGQSHDLVGEALSGVHLDRYGTGADPVLDTRQSLADADWERLDGNVWRAEVVFRDAPSVNNGAASARTTHHQLWLGDQLLAW